MSARRKLLFLCQTLPYPPDGGVWIRTFHVLRLLAREFDVTALCFERAATSGTDSRHAVDACNALGSFADVHVFPIPQRHSRLRYLWDHVRSTTLGRVYTTYLFESAAFRKRLADVLESTRFDLVHVDSLDLAHYLPACCGIPIIAVHHDVESNLLQRRAAAERSGWRSAYLAFQSVLRRKLERHWCERIALNVVVSEHDGASLKQLAPGARVAVVPNGVDTEEFHPDSHEGCGLAFVGGASTFPNADALEFFCERVLPHLTASGIHAPVRWIGRAPAKYQSYGDRWGVELTGYVDDVRPSMSRAACHIVPIRVGGGTRVKILNSWAMGKPVVSTSVGCEGLAAVDGENILIRDDPGDFAKAILAVLANEDLRCRLGHGGRATVERLYSWNAIGSGMIQTYSAVAHGTFSEIAPTIAVPGATAPGLQIG